MKSLSNSSAAETRSRRGSFEFKPQATFWLVTNHLPRVKGQDYAIWRRLMLIPFTVLIPEDERDADLGLKLQSEAQGILRWAVDGCAEWQQQGLNPPKVVIFDGTNRSSESIH